MKSLTKLKIVYGTSVKETENEYEKFINSLDFSRSQILKTTFTTTTRNISSDFGAEDIVFSIAIFYTLLEE